MSSAKFEPEKVEVERRVGVDLVLPLAAILPLERHVWWASKKLLPGRLAENMLNRASTSADALLIGHRRLPVILTKNKKLNRISSILGLVKPDHIQMAIDLAGEKLDEANKRAVANHDYLAATLTGLKIALENGQTDGVLLRSRR